MDSKRMMHEPTARENGTLRYQRETDPRLGQVYALAEGCGYEVEHAHMVTGMAVRLFDAMVELHGLGVEDRFWLTCAGLLHDIGWNEGRQGHHKRAAKIIGESKKLEWDEETRRVVGLVARYHRKALPSMEHDDFARLVPRHRETVRKMAAMLRVADGLDYRHMSVVRELGCSWTEKRITIACVVNGEADVEAERGKEKADLMEQVFQREVCIAWQQ